MNTAERKQVYFNKPQRLLKTDSTENKAYEAVKNKIRAHDLMKGHKRGVDISY